MNATAIQAKHISETNAGPLRVLHSTIATDIIARYRLDNRLVGGGHLHHIFRVFVVADLTLKTRQKGNTIYRFYVDEVTKQVDDRGSESSL